MRDPERSEGASPVYVIIYKYLQALCEGEARVQPLYMYVRIYV